MTRERITADGAEERRHAYRQYVEEQLADCPLPLPPSSADKQPSPPMRTHQDGKLIEPWRPFT